MSSECCEAISTAVAEAVVTHADAQDTATQTACNCCFPMAEADATAVVI